MSNPSTSLPLQNKVAVVTRGSRGLGAGMVMELAKRGADIVITYTSPNSASLVDSLTDEVAKLSHKPRVWSVRANLASTSGPEEIISAIKDFLKESPVHIDILVNNAGTELNKTLGDITPEEYASVYDLNVRGTLLMTQAVLPYMPPNSRIINLSSVGGRAGFAGLGLYCSSKAAIEGLTRVWAAELGKNGTTVNAVSPGPVESDMLANIPAELVKSQKEGTPVQKRLGTVQDIADIVAWLASEESRWVTGQVISASGGWAMY